MQREQLTLASKAGSSLLSPLERRLAERVVPRIPARLGTHHLTLMTLAWCAGLPAFGYLARGDARWLWGSSVMIALQWVTDFFDGKVGKHRDTGLVKWGFYMDHLLDFVFLCAVLGGYALVLPERAHLGLFLVLAVFGGFMVNSFLAFAATGAARTFCSMSSRHSWRCVRKARTQSATRPPAATNGSAFAIRRVP